MGLLRRLADARLVILDTDTADRGPYAELAHDSLITAWQRLRDLIADNADFLSWSRGYSSVPQKAIRCRRRGSPKRDAGSTPGLVTSRMKSGGSSTAAKPRPRPGYVSA